jgi:hypothetical protein
VHESNYKLHGKEVKFRARADDKYLGNEIKFGANKKNKYVLAS